LVAYIPSDEKIHEKRENMDEVKLVTIDEKESLKLVLKRLERNYEH